MSINCITREIVAKLLAQENITIKHQIAQTAAFDVKNRILVLPIYKDITDNIYDLFVSHECSHALHTPPKNWEEVVSKNSDEYKNVLNILEDARVDKLIKRRFPGLGKIFLAAFKELCEKDFFGTKDQDLSTYHFLDRLNLHFKSTGVYIISFSPEEKKLVSKAENLEKFEDVLVLAKEIYNRYFEEQPKQSQPDAGENSEKPSGDKASKDKVEKKSAKQSGEENSEQKEQKSDTETTIEKPESDNPAKKNASGDDQNSSSADNQETGNNSDEPPSLSDADKFSDADNGQTSQCPNPTETPASNSSEESQEKSNQQDSNTAPMTKGGKSDPEKEAGITLKKQEENISKCLKECPSSWRDRSYYEPTYYNFPDDIDLSKIVIDHKTLHAILTSHYKYSKTNEISLAQLALKDFHSRNDSVINYLVKEFEMKKSADQYTRTKLSKTGTINTNKLYSYKFNDDIFRSITNISDGKNHGLMMFVDCSGSMDSYMAPTLEQMLILVLFCRKVSIPFKVYGFTDRRSHTNLPSQYNEYSIQKPSSVDMSQFFLKEYFSSDMSNADFQQACLNVQCLINFWKVGGYSGTNTCPYIEKLHGTPLNSAIVASVKLIREFQESRRIQKVNAIFLTDGESCPLSHTLEDGCPGHMIYGSTNTVWRSLRTKKEYKREYSHQSETTMLFDYLRDEANINVIGFYIVSSNLRIRSIRRILDGSGLNLENIRNSARQFVRESQLRLEKAFGYDEYYLLASQELAINDKKFLLDNGDRKMNNRKMATVLSKNLNCKLRNRVILSKFIEKIA